MGISGGTATRWKTRLAAGAGAVLAASAVVGTAPAASAAEVLLDTTESATTRTSVSLVQASIAWRFTPSTSATIGSVQVMDVFAAQDLVVSIRTESTLCVDSFIRCPGTEVGRFSYTGTDSSLATFSGSAAVSAATPYWVRMESSSQLPAWQNYVPVNAAGAPWTITAGSDDVFVVNAGGSYLEDSGPTDNIGVPRMRMLAGGEATATGPAPRAALQQFAVPSGTTASQCSALAPAHIDWPGLEGQSATGWSVSYAQWPNDDRGGVVCTRQPYWNGAGWFVR